MLLLVSIASAKTNEVDFHTIVGPDNSDPSYKGCLIDAYPELFPPGLILSGFVLNYGYAGIHLQHCESEYAEIHFNDPVSRVGLWVLGDGIRLKAFNDNGGLVDQKICNCGPLQCLEVNGQNIKYVTIEYHLDDINVQSTQFDKLVYDTPDISVPEFPSIAAPIATVIGLVIIVGRKKRVIQYNYFQNEVNRYGVGHLLLF